LFMMFLKIIVKSCLYCLMVILGFLLGRATTGSKPPDTPDRMFHAGPTIERFADLSELLVVKLDVSDIVTTSIEGRTGGVQIILLVKGDVSLGVDLAGAHLNDVDRINRVAVLKLPPPSPSRPRLDHTRTRIFLIEKEGLWQFWPGTKPYTLVTDRAMAEAQDLVKATGATAEADRRARSHAEAVLQLFFKSLDWKVRIDWSDRSPA